MGRNTSVSLDDHFTGFVGELVRSGRYETEGDAIRAGLKLLEAHEARVQALQASLIAGENSGDPQPFDFDAFLARKRGARLER